MCGLVCGAVERGNGVSVPNCSWHEKGTESPQIRGPLVFSFGLVDEVG